MQISFEYVEREQVKLSPSIGLNLGYEAGMPALGLCERYEYDQIFDNNYVDRQTNTFKSFIEDLADKYSKEENIDVLTYQNHNHRNYHITKDTESVSVFMQGNFNVLPDNFKEFVNKVKHQGYGMPEYVSVNPSLVEWIKTPIKTFQTKKELDSYCDLSSEQIRINETQEKAGNKTIFRREITFA